MKINTKILIIFSAFLLFLLIGSIYLRNYLNPKTDQVLPEVRGIIDYSTYPAIQNMPPSKIIVGQGYIYDLAVIDSDTHYTDIKLNIIEGPNWLVANGLSLLGNPGLVDVGEHKVTIELSDGVHKVYKTFYILVESPYETE